GQGKKPQDTGLVRRSEYPYCFFIGRRGAGKTAITYEVERKFIRTIHITPQIFDLISLPVADVNFFDTRQRPFKSLICSMERAIVGEVIKAWADNGLFKFGNTSGAISRERGLIEDCDFDQRILNLTQEILEAYQNNNEKMWLRQIKRSTQIVEEANELVVNGNYRYVIMIDRLDESWDGSNSAIICLMALMHASVRLLATTDFIRPYIFIRENIYDRIRAADNEFSRLETSVVFLDWKVEKLVELIERRLVQPFGTKPKLGGEAWSYFFEDDNKVSIPLVMNLCQHRPRDVVMLISYAIDSAISRGNEKITQQDLTDASKRYSTSRLKDLGDEYAENYPNIILILKYFYGLGTQFTVNAVDGFIRKILINKNINDYCSEWIYNHATPFSLVELLYSIGFMGINKGGNVEYKEPSKDSNIKPSFDKNTIFEIHSTYRQALNLREVLISDLDDDAVLQDDGMLEDLPEGFELDGYKPALERALKRLNEIPFGTTGANDFENVVGDVIKLCFYRSLTNVQPRERMSNGSCIRDWIVANRAADGFWEVVRNKYGATQVVWECKNYAELHSDDFHQIQYYLSDTFGKFGIIVFRGEIKKSYYRHISNIANKNAGGIVLLLTQRDLEVFLRQAISGAFKEAHIQDKYDTTIRQIS
ncbi:MAG: transposase, partial [SAR324 cluster bacterium]|nr:transposase [SAR324 cluster bacterium]